MKVVLFCAYSYDGFWACMDTFKEKQHLDELYARGRAPWEVWKSTPANNGNGQDHAADQIRLFEENSLSGRALG